MRNQGQLLTCRENEGHHTKIQLCHVKRPKYMSTFKIKRNVNIYDSVCWKRSLKTPFTCSFSALSDVHFYSS